MRFRNYCIIIMGNTQGVNDEIRRIAEMEPNFLETNGITIATLTSPVTPTELTEWFKSNNRNVIVFDLDSNASGVHFNKNQIQEGLFGFIDHVDLNQMNEDFNDRTNLVYHHYKEIYDKEVSLIEEISGDTINNLLSEKSIEKMDKKEKENLLNKLIENGLDKLTDNDKKLLPLLTK